MDSESWIITVLIIAGAAVIIVPYAIGSYNDNLAKKEYNALMQERYSLCLEMSRDAKGCDDTFSLKR